ncbi:MAG: deoxynucleoside kinase [Candidatus Sungbacteria bacterium]|nr:deoxynucleoside kinase [Candidatus Sungbacteria bacterium]
MEAKKKNHYISVAGIMGSGKTTAAHLLSRELGFHLIEENVAENAFLPLFYKDAKRWALPTQLFYLHEKARQLNHVMGLLSQTSVIQDSPIYQDYFTYAIASKTLGYTSEDEHTLYERFYSILKENLPVPDLIIALEASLPIVESRIKKRSRGFEKDVNMSYVKLLSELQKEWIREHPHLNIMVVNTDDLDLSSDPAHQKHFVELIKNRIEN